MLKKSYHPEVTQLIEIGNYIYKQLGHGCKEDVYREVLELELELRNIPYKRNCSKPTNSQSNKERFVCFDKIIVGLETHSFLSEDQENIFMNSLKGLDAPLGLLFNFGYANLQYIKVGGQCSLQ